MTYSFRIIINSNIYHIKVSRNRKPGVIQGRKVTGQMLAAGLPKEIPQGMPFRKETVFFCSPPHLYSVYLWTEAFKESLSVENREAIYARQVQYVYKYLPASIVANIINGSILVFVQWTVISGHVLLIWFVCLAAVNLARWISYQSYRRNLLKSFSDRIWGNFYIFLLFISAVVWGSTGIWLFPEDNVVHHIFIVFILGGMTAGAAASTAALGGAFYFYCYPMIAPITIRYFLEGDKVHLSMGLLILIYALFSTLTARHVHRIIYDSIKLVFENEYEVSVRKKAEESLRESLERIEEKVGERTAELVEANRRLKEEILEREQAEEEKRELIDTLEKTLSEVKTLSGLLPICAACKKIRDDRGYWKQIESYLSEHSNAVFSHSICPECSRKLYPELDEPDED